MLERVHLAIIREVDQKGSLTAAAESLCLTQPALSHTIKKLEERMGTPIWHREGRSLRLTQVGQYLLNLANRLVPQLEHTEQYIKQYVQGERGTLNIGMECHPCYQWLLKVVEPYLKTWPHIDIDVKQKFKFGGIAGLLGYEIDVLVTPDPLFKPSLRFEPVFDYEQVLVVGKQHALTRLPYVLPTHLANETLITYPVAIERLDIFNQFLTPANVMPKRHKIMETTDIMLQMVASDRGVAALPRWLVEEYASKMPIAPVRLGKKGIQKQIFLGIRDEDAEVEYLKAFIELGQDTDNLQK